MAKYTTELRSILENYAGLSESVGYEDVGTVITAARGKLFDFDYPIFDKSYRSVLETKICKHFYTREIGAETVGRFKLFLDMKLNEIMPYYNKLYTSELIEFNPLYNVDYSTQHTTTGSGSSEDTGTSRTDFNGQDVTTSNGSKNNDNRYIKDDEYTDTRSGGENTTSSADSSGNSTTGVTATKTTASTDLYSATPQGAITGLDAGDHLTNARKIFGTETENSTTTNSATTHGEDTGAKTYTENFHHVSDDVDTDELRETTSGRTVKDSVNTTTGQTGATNTFTNLTEYTEHVTGKNSGESFSKMLEQFRNTFLNIDMDIIKDLEILFMGVC